MSQPADESIDIKDLPKKFVNCRHCKEPVQLGVLPFHEKLCEDARNQFATSISPFKPSNTFRPK
jgi:hypothetical protein